MSWLSKYGGGALGVGFSVLGISPVMTAIQSLNKNDTVPQASADPRIANSATSTGQVVGTNTGGYGAPGIKR